MKTLQCPRCFAVVRAISSDVTHRCPNARHQHVAFVEIPEKTNDE